MFCFFLKKFDIVRRVPLANVHNDKDERYEDAFYGEGEDGEDEAVYKEHDDDEKSGPMSESGDATTNTTTTTSTNSSDAAAAANATDIAIYDTEPFKRAFGEISKARARP